MRKKPLLARSLDRTVAEILRDGGVGVIPTDTIYGIVASVLSRRAVERVYRLRRRDPKKPSIILISNVGDLRALGIRPTPAQKRMLGRIWPGRFSVVFRTRAASFLDRGTGTLAVRLPQSVSLRRFLNRTGPLIAPSANFEGRPPAATVRAARRYFGDRVDLYVDKGTQNGAPSTLVAFSGRRFRVLRRGSGKLPRSLEYGTLK